jgi:protein translocase SecG subunit
MDLIITLLYILFIVSAIVLVVVVLLQEGRGGGLTDALGTAGQQTFGVAASGIHKFTGWTGVAFVGSALLIHFFNRQVSGGSVVGEFEQPAIEAPAEGGAPAGDAAGDAAGGAAGGAAPAGGDAAPAGGTTPPAGGGTPPEEPK